MDVLADPAVADLEVDCAGDPRPGSPPRHHHEEILPEVEVGGCQGNTHRE
jgi:hypothetical protein